MVCSNTVTRVHVPAAIDTAHALAGAAADFKDILFTNVVDTWKTTRGLSSSLGRVTSWLGDKGHDLAESNTARQPALTVGGSPNGADAVESDATDNDLFDLSITGGPVSGGNAHMLQIGKFPDDPTAKESATLGGTTHARLLTFAPHANDNRASAFNNAGMRTTTSGLTDHTNDWHLFEARIDGNELEIWLDGVLDSSFTLTNTGLNGNVDRIFAFNTTTATNSAPNLLVAEFAVLSDIADAAELAILKSYVNSEYELSTV